MLVTGKRWTSSTPLATGPKSFPVGIWPSTANSLEAQASSTCGGAGGATGTGRGTCAQAGAARAAIANTARAACVIIASYEPIRAADFNRIVTVGKDHSPPRRGGP